MTQQRAAAAFHSWLWDGLLARGYENVEALANALNVPAKVVVDLWHDQTTAGMLGSRLADGLHSYLGLFGCHFVAEAGGFGDKANLERPSLAEIVDELVEEWNGTLDHGCLAPLPPEGFRRLLLLAVNGALSQLRLSVLCDSVPDDEPARWP